MRAMWERLLRAHAVAPGAVLVLFIFVPLFAYIRFWRFDSSTCPGFNADGSLPTGAFAAIVGAFFLGGLLGGLPHKRTEKGQDVALRAAQLGLTVFVALIAAAWYYETLAIANPGTMEPITYFIMCIKGYENDWTLLVFILAALIAGRWLWHRPGNYLT